MKMPYAEFEAAYSKYYAIVYNKYMPDMCDSIQGDYWVGSSSDLHMSVSVTNKDDLYLLMLLHKPARVLTVDVKSRNVFDILAE